MDSGLSWTVQDGTILIGGTKSPATSELVKQPGVVQLNFQLKEDDKALYVDIILISSNGTVQYYFDMIRNEDEIPIFPRRS